MFIAFFPFATNETNENWWCERERVETERAKKERESPLPSTKKANKQNGKQLMFSSK